MFIFVFLNLAHLGGGGGKGTWGKSTEVYDDDGLTNDIHDPNYDSENEEVWSALRIFIAGLN